MGMRTGVTSSPAHASLRPAGSAPTTMATAPVQVDAVVVDGRLHPGRDDGDVAAARRKARASAAEQAASGRLKMVPRLARMALGFQRSETGSATMTASTPAPSAERNSAPRLPGFSTRSTTATSGRSGEGQPREIGRRALEARPRCHRRAPHRPAGPAAPGVVSTTSAPAAPSRGSRAGRPRRAAVGRDPGLDERSRPASRARPISRAPSTRRRCCARRSRASRSARAALKRGFWRCCSRWLTASMRAGQPCGLPARRVMSGASARSAGPRLPRRRLQLSVSSSDQSAPKTR